METYWSDVPQENAKHKPSNSIAFDSDFTLSKWHSGGTNFNDYSPMDFENRLFVKLALSEMIKKGVKVCIITSALNKYVVPWYTKLFADTGIVISNGVYAPGALTIYAPANYSDQNLAGIKVKNMGEFLSQSSPDTRYETTFVDDDVNNITAMQDTYPEYPEGASRVNCLLSKTVETDGVTAEGLYKETIRLANETLEPSMRIDIKGIEKYVNTEVEKYNEMLARRSSGGKHKRKSVKRKNKRKRETKTRRRRRT